MALHRWGVLGAGRRNQEMNEGTRHQAAEHHTQASLSCLPPQPHDPPSSRAHRSIPRVPPPTHPRPTAEACGAAPPRNAAEHKQPHAVLGGAGGVVAARARVRPRQLRQVPLILVVSGVKVCAGGLQLWEGEGNESGSGRAFQDMTHTVYLGLWPPVCCGVGSNYPPPTPMPQPPGHSPPPLPPPKYFHAPRPPVPRPRSHPLCQAGHR